jgi:hypothetical protein
MSALVVMDAQRRIALVVGRSGKRCQVLRLASGTLRLEKLDDAQLWREFREFSYPLPAAVARFQQHGALHGMTKAARTALDQLAEAPEQQRLALG